MAYDDTTQACVTEAANQGAVGVIVSSGADEVSAAAAALISVGRFQNETPSEVVQAPQQGLADEGAR